MSEEAATIIDTKSMVDRMEKNEKLSRLKIAKKLNKIANLEIENEDGKKKNPFQNMKIPRSSLRKKSTKRKKQIMDLEKITVEGYTYDEFSKAINNSLPHLINHVSFQDEKFLQRLRESRDIKHFASTQILFDITNDYLGLAGAIIAAGVDYYTEHKLGKPQQPQIIKDVTKEPE